MTDTENLKRQLLVWIGAVDPLTPEELATPLAKLIDIGLRRDGVVFAVRFMPEMARALDNTDK